MLAVTISLKNGIILGPNFELYQDRSVWKQNVDTLRHTKEDW